MPRIRWVIAWAVLAAAAAGVFFVWYGPGMRLKERLGGVTPPPREPTAQVPGKGEHAGHEGMPMPAAQSSQETGMSMKMAPGAVMVSPEKQQLIGLKTDKVGYRSIERTIRTVGVLEFDERRLADVNIKIEGWIEDLLVNFTGESVKKGQPLLTIYSPDLVSTQEEYLQALHAQDTLSKSRFPDIVAGAHSLVGASRRRLQYWDISDEDIATLERTRTPRKSLTLHSPIDGVVIEKTVFRGKKVMPGESLYKVADLSNVWVQGEIYEYEVPLVKLGQLATVTIASYPEEVFRGKVNFISPVLQEKTRTVKVRFEFPNTKDWKLKPQMYANVELKIPFGKRLVVPDEAVLDSGTQQLAFIDKGRGTFEPRNVKLGARAEGYVEVLAGLTAGERVVTSANFLLDSESKLRESMGLMAAMPGMERMRTGSMEGMQGMEKTQPGLQMTPKAPSGPQEKQVGDVILTFSPVPSPAKVGENILRVRLTDSKGEVIKTAKVSFSFTMPMPGMSAVSAVAILSKDGFYEAKANLGMGGTWQVTVRAIIPGRPEVKQVFVVTTGSGQ